MSVFLRPRGFGFELLARMGVVDVAHDRRHLTRSRCELSDVSFRQLSDFAFQSFQAARFRWQGSPLAADISRLRRKRHQSHKSRALLVAGKADAALQHFQDIGSIWPFAQAVFLLQLSKLTAQHRDSVFSLNTTSSVTSALRASIKCTLKRSQTEAWDGQ